MNGKYLHYPNNNFILDQLGNVRELRIAGFHMWDCVEKLAKRSHERGLDTLVDEDLTEFFTWEMGQNGFKVEDYDPVNRLNVLLNGGHGLSNKAKDEFLAGFLKARKNKPWLWQEY